MKSVFRIGALCAVGLIAGSRPGWTATTYAYDGQGRLKTVITDDNKQTTYTLDDASNRTQVAGVASGTNKPPKAHDRTFAVPTSGASSGHVTFDPTTGAGADTDPEGQALSVVGVTQGQLGAVTRTGNSITYTADNQRVTASDSFTYIIQDAGGLTDSGVITMTLQNVPPTAVNDTYGSPTPVPRNTPYLLTPSPIANDHDAGEADGVGVSIVGVGTPNAVDGGTVTFTYNTMTFTSNPGFTGASVFSYTISDADGGQATATITINVSSANTAPATNVNGTTDGTAVITGHSVEFDPTHNDADAEGDPFSLSIITAPTHGSACVITGAQCLSSGALGDHTIRYTPSITENGTDTLVYRITDALGASATPGSTSTVAITIIKSEGGQ